MEPTPFFTIKKAVFFSNVVFFVTSIPFAILNIIAYAHGDKSWSIIGLMLACVLAIISCFSYFMPHGRAHSDLYVHALITLGWYIVFFQIFVSAQCVPCILVYTAVYVCIVAGVIRVFKKNNRQPYQPVANSDFEITSEQDDVGTQSDARHSSSDNEENPPSEKDD